MKYQVFDFDLKKKKKKNLAYYLVGVSVFDFLEVSLF